MNFNQRLGLLQMRANQAQVLSSKMNRLENAETTPTSTFDYEKRRGIAGGELSQELLREIFEVGRAELLRRVQEDLTAVLSDPVFPPEPAPNQEPLKNHLKEITKRAAQTPARFGMEGTPPDMRPHEATLQVGSGPILELPAGTVIEGRSIVPGGVEEWDVVPNFVPPDLGDPSKYVNADPELMAAADAVKAKSGDPCFGMPMSERI